MGVKKAIEFCENIIQSTPTIKPRQITIEKIKGIITLLQQGEKYRQMWEEFNEWLSEKNICGSDYHNYYVKLINKKNDIKQKYFPKGGEPK